MGVKALAFGFSLEAESLAAAALDVAVNEDEERDVEEEVVLTVEGVDVAEVDDVTDDNVLD